MGLVVLAVIIVIALAVISAANRKSSFGPEDPWPFFAKKPLSAPEQVLYFRLKKSLPEHIILAQVGLSRLLGVKKGNNFKAWKSHQSHEC